MDAVVTPLQVEQLITFPKTDDTPTIPRIGDDDSPYKEAVDRTSASMKEVYKSLTVFAQEVLRKLDEILGDKLPGGIASLNPEDHTSEKTAQRIVDGVTALFSIFSDQHPELEGAELMSAFLETVRGGIDRGYNDAKKTLGDIGAFEFDGVADGIEKTMALVDEKLKAFEKRYFEENGFSTKDEGEEAPEVVGQTPVVQERVPFEAVA